MDSAAVKTCGTADVVVMTRRAVAGGIGEYYGRSARGVASKGEACKAYTKVRFDERAQFLIFEQNRVLAYPGEPSLQCDSNQSII